jgi:hypothetical protein
MIPNIILAKIDDLCEKWDIFQAALKVSIEDPFTQTEFSRMFSIKIHHLCMYVCIYVIRVAKALRLKRASHR